MANPALELVSRNERRMLLAAEARNRETGEWGPWETITFPPGTVGRGWTFAITTCHKNKVFSVLERQVENVVHYGISSLSNRRPTWWEMQRIKDELAGKDKTAVEVYPPHSEIVDEADMFHIWILPDRLPFGLR